MSTHPSLSQELWERTPPEVRAYIEAVDARQASREALEARVATLEALVQALQEQLNQTSRNSSRPPASDPPQHDRPRRPRSQRRRGGQPGHPGHTRTLIPVDEVQEVVVIKPEQCLYCDAPLRAALPRCCYFLVTLCLSQGEEIL
jgi:transposase